MYKVVNREIKFSDGRVFKTGDTILDEDFSKELPEERKRGRIIAQLIDSRRMIVATEIPKPLETVVEVAEEAPIPSKELKYIPVGRYELPNGEIIKGKEAALKRLEEIKE